MALLGRKKKEDKKEEASISQDGNGEALENSDDVTDNGVSDGGEANAEQALLNQYTEGLAPIAQSDDDESTEENTEEPPAEEPAEEPAEDDVSDSLMDIFASEEEEDADLSALTFGLEDIDVQSLLSEAKNVASRLRTLVESLQKSA